MEGRAIGVLGTGIDVCYPKENKKLYEKVPERGTILSEFPMHTHPAPENTPVRNRIVAEMPLGAIIVEGAQYSGSLITARLAMSSPAKSSACRATRRKPSASRRTCSSSRAPSWSPMRRT